MNELLREEMGEVNDILIDIYSGEIEEDQAKERFKIKNLESANWAFRKLKAIEEQEAEIKALMDKEIKRIQEWGKHDLDKIKDSKAFFNQLLEEYYLQQRALNPKFKISTPYGNVSSKKQQPKWIYEDDVVLTSLHDKGLSKFIRVKEEVNKADLKKEVEIMEFDLGYVCVYKGEILGEVRAFDEDGKEYVNVETGEVYNTQDDGYGIYEQLVLHDGKIIEGVKVEKQPDSITIKVEV